MDLHISKTFCTFVPTKEKDVILFNKIITNQQTKKIMDETMYSATKNDITVTIKSYNETFNFFKELPTRFRYALHHKEMDLGQYEYSLDQYAFDNWEEYKYGLEDVYEPAFISPVYMWQAYETGEVKFSTKPFKQEFDSMQVGFAYVTLDEIEEICENDNLKFVSDIYLQSILEKELAAYEMFMNGTLYTIEVNDETYGPFYIPEWINEETLKYIPYDFIDDIKEAQLRRNQMEE